MSAKPKTNVIVILDKSGSMEAVRQATIDGFNEYLAGLRKDTPEATLSLTLFNHAVDAREPQAVKYIKGITMATYEPGGSTSLYDAVCSTLKDAKKNKTDKNLVVIITDGMENTSTTYTEKDLAKLVKELEAMGNWSFVYLGANQDAWANASQWGFRQDNVASFNATGAGIGATFSAMSAATANYTRSAGMNTKAYFSQEQKDNMEATK